MNFPENCKLFTIKEFSEACRLSRSTILRLEECGFLVPRKTDHKNGYRYYDANNVSEVLQFRLLQTLGLSRNDISDYYSKKTDGKKLLEEQRKRLIRMQRVLEEMELRFDKSRNFSVSYVDLPEMYCYCGKGKQNDPSGAELDLYRLLENCLVEGFHVAPDPLFATSGNDFKSLIPEPGDPPEITYYIPLENPEKSKKTKKWDSNLVHIPAVRAFSVLAYGDYSILNDLCIKFWEEVKDRNIRPTGPARFIGIVAPFVGRNISPDDYCYRLAVPIE